MHAFVTGGAGFIGSNLVDRLLAEGHTVTAYDNLSTGQLNFLAEAQHHPNFQLVKGDILDLENLTRAMKGAEIVFHLSANADVRFGLEHPRKDLEQNTIGTFNVLEAMRACGVRRILFSSTGSVYGEPDEKFIPMKEDGFFPIQTSLYGASKAAGEGLLSAYAEGFGFTIYITRFTSILGKHYSHGHVFDFVKKLRENPNELTVLGNGYQRKSYTDVSDCINAIMTIISHPQAQEKVNIFNLGTDEYCTVRDSLGWICAKLGLHPQVKFTGGERGWIGDNKFILLDATKLKSLGWSAQYTIREGVERTVDYLLADGGWLFEQR